MNFLPANPNFADFLDDDIIDNSQPLSLTCSQNMDSVDTLEKVQHLNNPRSYQLQKHTRQQGEFRSIEEIDPKYRTIFTYPYFNLVQSRVIEDALYSDKSIVICAPTGSGKTVVFEMAIAQLLMDIEDKNYQDDFKIIYMAPVKALCTERLTEWYPKLTQLGLLCIEVTGDTEVEFPQLKPYKVIITTPEKWDMLTRRWRDYRGLVEVVKLFLIDEVHILNDNVRGPVLEAVVSRMKTIESSVQSTHRIEQLQKQYSGNNSKDGFTTSPRIRFVAVSATVNNPEDVAAWLGTADKPAVYYKFGDECRPVKITRVVEGYSCPQGTSIFKFDIILNYKLWPIIQKYHNGKPTLIFCNTRKSVQLTAEALSREITINFSPDQKAKLTALASTLKNKKLQALILNGVGCHHAGLLFEERMNIERAFRNRDLPILITTTTLAMGVNLPAHLVIIKNTQQYVNGAYQEYSISTILQMVGRAGRPQFDTEATAVIMTRAADKARYQALVEGTEPLQSFLHKRLAENLNSEAALGTVTDVAQCVQWVNSTFLSVRAAKDPRRYLGLPNAAPANEITKKIEELCVKAMNMLASSGLITMDENSCIESTEAGKLMSVYYIDLETMKLIMKIEGSESLERLLWLLCESHELADMHLRVDERRCLNALNRNNTAATIRFPMKGKISCRQMKLNCVIQAVLGCLPIPDPSLNQEAMKIMRIALRVCKCLVAYTTRPTSISQQPKTFSAVLNSIVLTKCLSAYLWENSPYVSKQLRGIGPTFSMLLASAGKTNFLLLEESHPRDLERIMNKGPPAGNIIRKQVSLLPKYQLTISPIDKDIVQIKLMLLNLAYLSENMENFTAGVNHKSYIIVGDSENNLLYLTSFKDTDLINIYDGCVTCEVTRKLNQEHKVTAYCISSSFVGIDVQTEYLFIEIENEPKYVNKTECNRRLNIIDVCRGDAKSINAVEQRPLDRKRKFQENKDMAYSKEKIKRNTSLLKNFRSLKESFSKTTKEIMGNVQKSTQMSEGILQNLTRTEYQTERFEPIDLQNLIPSDSSVKLIVDDSLDKDEVFENLEDEDKINNILSEIENEIGKTSNKPLYTQKQQQTLLFNDLNKRDDAKYKAKKIMKAHKKHVKCNFDVIDALEQDIHYNDKNDVIFINDDTEGFTNTVKFKIDQYLQNAQSTEESSRYKDIVNVLQLKNIDTDNDKKCSREVVADEISVDCTQVQQDSFINQSKSGTVDQIPLLIKSIEEESDKRYLEDSTENNGSVKDRYNNFKNKHTSNCKNFLVASSEDHINSTRLSTSSRLDIIDDKNEFGMNQNNSNLVISTDIPLEYKNVQAIHGQPCNQSNSRCTESCDQNLSDSNLVSEINNLYCTSDFVRKISHELENNSLLLEHTSQPKMYDNKNGLEQNFNDGDKIHETNELIVTHSSLAPILRNSGTLLESQDASKFCLNYSKKNKLEYQKSSIAQNCDFKNTDSNDTTYNMNNTVLPFNPNEEDDICIEKYCFRTAQFNICSENDNKHIVKIIRKVKIDLDITKIVSTKKEKTNTNDPAFEFTHKNIPKCTEKIEPVINIVDITVNNQPKAALGRNIKNDTDNMDLNDESMKTAEKIAIQSLPEIEKLTSNEAITKNVNEVEDLLKKYSVIMSSRKQNSIVIPVTKLYNNNITEIPVEKPKRRYKISDILNSKAPLPKKLINDFNPINMNNKMQDQNEVNNCNHRFIDDLPSSDKYINIPELNLHEITPVQTEFLNESDTYKVNANVVSPDRKTPELPEIFDINNTLLNPKTLLQCYNAKSDIDEVIPPPEEFSDNTNLYSHISERNIYLPLSPDYEPEIISYNVLNKSSDYETNDVSILFDEFSQTNRDNKTSPSEEIDSLMSPNTKLNKETITPCLMQDAINSTNATQSNTPGISTRFSNSRADKLGEFKYKRKNLLRIKK